VVVLLLTSTLTESPLLRYALEPSDENGLRARSQVQVDKVFSVSRKKVGPTIGRLDEETMATVSRLMALFLGLT
jgi:mRNA interferase MazF